MKLRIAAICIAISSTGAVAADMGAAPYAKAPMARVYDWTGFYIGAQGGYGWSDSQGLDLKGGFAGGTVGYNWQTGSLVLGIEGEGAWADIGQTAGIVGLLTVGTKLEAFGSIAGRVGYAFDNLLIYGKGGFAAASNNVNVTVLGVPFNSTRTHVGYTLGGGLEYGFSRNWSAKVEYLWAHYDSQTYFSGTAAAFASGDIDVSTVKAGVNYRF